MLIFLEIAVNDISILKNLWGGHASTMLGACLMTAKPESHSFSVTKYQSQPDSLVMLCRFKHYHYLFLKKLIPYTVYEQRKICIA